MTDQVITGGLVRVEDGLKRAEEYAPPRKVAVEIRFDVGGGVDPVAVLAEASELAHNQVEALLGRPQSSGAAPVTATATSGRTRKARSTAATTVEELASPPKDDPGLKTNEGDNQDPFAVGAEPEAVAAEPKTDDAFDLGTVEPVTEVTDADLNAAVQKKHKELGTAVPIHGLIRTFNPDPTKQFQVRQITQAQRPDFLVKLEALTKS